MPKFTGILTAPIEYYGPFCALCDKDYYISIDKSLCLPNDITLIIDNCIHHYSEIE